MSIRDEKTCCAFKKKALHFFNVKGWLLNFPLVPSECTEIILLALDNFKNCLRNEIFQMNIPVEISFLSLPKLLSCSHPQHTHFLPVFCSLWVRASLGSELITNTVLQLPFYWPSTPTAPAERLEKQNKNPHQTNSHFSSFYCISRS